MQESKFELLVDGVPYMIKATPFEFNTETRYKVSYNGGRENIFAWDTDMKQMRAIDNDASTIPDNLEMAISKRLQAGF